MNFDLGSRGVARSLRNDICILAPGSCIPACQANWCCFSRKRALGEEVMLASWRAMAIASEAGPKPTQRRSRTSSEEVGDMEAVWPFVWPLR